MIYIFIHFSLINFHYLEIKRTTSYNNQHIYLYFLKSNIFILQKTKK